jgi:hypothetical protein
MESPRRARMEKMNSEPEPPAYQVVEYLYGKLVRSVRMAAKDPSWLLEGADDETEFCGEPAYRPGTEKQENL